MKFINPSVEWWPQKNVPQQIAKVGRLCYKTQGAQPDPSLSEEECEQFIEQRDEERCRGFWNAGHRSMYRHGSLYFYLKHQGKAPAWIWSVLSSSPYIDYTTRGKQVWISTNMHYLCDHKKLMAILAPFEVTEEEFIDKALNAHCNDALMLLRMTLVVTTQISTSRELNRTSPNSISEQSTRYVNLGRKGGVQICEPHWYENPAEALRKKLLKDDNGEQVYVPLRFANIRAKAAKWVFRLSCKISEWSYLLLLKLGLTPQDARGALPLDAYTVVAYTYNIKEWKHIIDLRYHGTTGAPHPNAKAVGSQISDIINTRMRQYIPEFEI